MSFLRIVFILNFVFISLCPHGYAEKVPQFLVGYYGFWNFNTGIPPAKLPGNLLTHLVYAFVQVSDDGLCQLDPNDSLNSDGDPTVLSEIVKVKNLYPDLVVMMGVANNGKLNKFLNVATEEIKRKKFAQSCIALLKKYRFGGIDIDWEYALEDLSAEKKPLFRESYPLLLAELRKQLDAIPGDKILLSAAVGAPPKVLDDLNISGIVKYLDWLGVMSYDLYNEVTPTTGHHAGLFPPRDGPGAINGRNGEAAINTLIEHGAKAEQIVLGVPFYGHLWKNVPSKDHGLYQKFEGVPAEGATLSYADLQDKYLSNSSYSHFWDDQVQSPWLYSEKENIFVSYEDPRSLKIKTEYARKKHLKGVMIWDLNHDPKCKLLNRSTFR